jgi:predicted negative regulator of RcsB-dependent stress response
VTDLTPLLREKQRTAARVVGAAQCAVWFFEAQNFEDAYQSLKNALDEHNKAERAYLEALKSDKENSAHGNRANAA